MMKTARTAWVVLAAAEHAKALDTSIVRSLMTGKAPRPPSYP
jgi:hypothetical protein